MTEAPSMADAPRSVSITSSGPMATVIVDDTDLSKRVNGYQIEHRAGEFPLVVLFSRPGTEVVMEGLAQVAVATEPDHANIITSFLRSMDPAVLEAAALQRDDLDGSRHELTRAMLATLADIAQGKAVV